jgi:hypothetical protein
VSGPPLVRPSLTVTGRSPEAPDVLYAHRRWIPAVALLFCCAGLAALFLPLVNVRTTESYGVAAIGLAITDIPFGDVLVWFFVVLSMLPLFELVRSGPRLTIALLVPGALGLFVLLVGAQLVSFYVDVVRNTTGLLPDGQPVSFDLGAGAYLLLVADLGILTAGVLSAAMGRRRLPVPPPMGPQGWPQPGWQQPGWQQQPPPPPQGWY